MTKNDLLLKLKFKNYTKLQEDVFLLWEKPSNILISSKTGSGKTYAYSIPVMLDLINKGYSSLIIVPTNDLLNQVYDMINLIRLDEKIIKLDDKIKLDDIPRINRLDKKVVITTPNKIFYFREKGLNFKNFKNIIYDECDMLLEGDFFSKLKELFHYFKNSRQVVVSATIKSNFKPFIKENIGSFITVDDKNRFAGQNHFLIFSNDKDEVLKKLVNVINPFLCIIFTIKKENVYSIFDILKRLGKNAIYISSDDKKELRNKKINDIKKNKYQFIISTDLLARGIDFFATDIINYDIPSKLEYFIHRSGRTARMDKTGNIYTIYSDFENRKISNLKNKGIKFKLFKIVDGKIITYEKKSPRFSPDELKEIRKIKKPKKVSPNYKKKNIIKIKQVIKKIKAKRFRKRMEKGR